MTSYFYCYINIANIIILMIMLLMAIKIKNASTTRRNTFFLSMQLAILANVFDLIHRIMLDNIKPFPIFLFYIVYFLYFILYCLSCFFWFIYSEYAFRKVFLKNKIIFSIFLFPIISLLVLSIINLFNGILYSFDNNLNLVKGPLFMLQYFLAYIYIYITSLKFIILAFKSSRQDKNSLMVYVSFALPPLCCAIAQQFLHGIPILSSAPVFSFLIAYTNTLSLQISIDPLTGIYNRRKFIIELKNKINNLPKNKDLYFLFLDVDRFKFINDTYGHHEGDRVLQLVSDALSLVSEENHGICGRYGGDEFTLALYLSNDKDINEICALIENYIEDRATNNSFDFLISVSIGVTKFNKDVDTIHSLIISADEKMYAKKEDNHIENDKSILSEKNRKVSFLESLFDTHFDGAMLLDIKHDRLIEINKNITKKIVKYFDFNNNSYSYNINNVINNFLSNISKDDLRWSTSIATIIEKLKIYDNYYVDFQYLPKDNRKPLYKRINYKYLDESKTYVTVSLEDISSVYQNDIDPLTGILDSTGFQNRVNKWLKNNPNKKFRIHRYNIDHFKDINGVYGHDIGDQLLRDIGSYMHNLDNKDSFCAHLNADHFVRFCGNDNFMSPQECYDKFKVFFANYHISIPISIHIGIYDLCEKEDDVNKMSYKALLALQTIKYNLNQFYAYYEIGMDENEQEKLNLVKEVDRAILNDEFLVYFQPQIDFSKHNLYSSEALVRWNHPTKGLISPFKFINLLEQSNYISKLDLYVIDKVCDYLKKWKEMFNDKEIQISVNLSRIDLLNKDFIIEMENILKSYKLPHSVLHLEITESAYMENSEEISKAVKYLRKKGFIIELDDFGSGYSSLNTLKNIDIDKLKLDMRFLSDEGSNEKGKKIVLYVIAMSRALNLPIIVEGVENKNQVDMLLSYGCSQMQGYYFSKPLPANEYEAFLLGNKKLEHLG